MASKMVAAKEISTISMFFCFRSAMFGQYACFGFNGWSRHGLRRIVSRPTVAMVTGNIDNV